MKEIRAMKTMMVTATPIAACADLGSHGASDGFEELLLDVRVAPAVADVPEAAPDTVNTRRVLGADPELMLADMLLIEEVRKDDMDVGFDDEVNDIKVVSVWSRVAICTCAVAQGCDPGNDAVWRCPLVGIPRGKNRKERYLKETL
jgi:hypothetical protein